MKVWLIVLWVLGGRLVFGQEEDLDRDGELEGVEVIQRVEWVLPDWNAEIFSVVDAGEFVPGSTIFGKTMEAWMSFEGEEVIEHDPSLMNLPEDEEFDERWMKVIPPNFLSEYFRKPPERYLMDPQGLLTAREADDLQAFLDYHARDTNIVLYLYLFDEKQQLPEGESLMRLIEEHFDPSKPYAVAFYFLGDPSRSRLGFSEKIRQFFPQNEQDKVLRMGVEEAMEKTERASQAESFAIQLSIRLYWLENVVSVDRGGVSFLGDLDLRDRGREVRKKGHWWDRLKGDSTFRTFFWGFCGILPIIAMGWGGMRFLESRRVYVFPDATGEPMLGAGSGVGVGGMIGFSASADPPAEQRRKISQ